MEQVFGGLRGNSETVTTVQCELHEGANIRYALVEQAGFSVLAARLHKK